jgi:hypothetical protein
VADGQDYIISEPLTPRAVDELVAAEKNRELDELLANALRELDCDQYIHDIITSQ